MSAKKTSAGQDAPSPDPQVIDLAPEEVVEVMEDRPAEESDSSPANHVEHEQHEAPPAAKPVPPPAHRKSGYVVPVLALLAGGIGGAWFYREALTPYFPDNTVTQLSERLSATEKLLAASDEKSSGLALQIANLKETRPQLDFTVVAAKADLDKALALAEATAARIAKAEQLASQTQQVTSDLKAAIATMGENSGNAGSVDTAAWTALNQRLAALEQELQHLRDARPTVSPKEQMALALGAVKQKLVDGDPFTDELSRLSGLVPTIALPPELQQVSTQGLPTSISLVEELRMASASLPNAQAPQPTPKDDSYSGWLLDQMSGIVTVRTIGAPDWQAAASEASKLAEAGDLQAAIDRINAIEGNKPEQLTAWVTKAQGKLGADAAMADFSDQILRAMASQDVKAP